MSSRSRMTLLSVLIILSVLLVQCGSTPAPQTIVQTVEVEKTVVETVEVEKEVKVVETVEVEKEVTVKETVEVPVEQMRGQVQDLL